MKSMPAQKNAFTLVELLVVVAIIGVLSTIGVTVFTGARQSANTAKVKADIDAIRKAYEGKYDPISATYAPITSSDFSEGTIPTTDGKPLATDNSNSYFIAGPNAAPSPTSAPNFALCAPLKSGVVCPSVNPGDCSCNTSTQGAPVAPYVINNTIPTTGLLLWLRADDINLSTLIDGSTVNLWRDQSGNNNNAIQGNSGYQPVYKTNIVNGKSALQFSVRYLDTQAFVIKQAYMVFRSTPPNSSFSTYGIPLGVTDYGQGRTFIFEAGQQYFHSNPYPRAVWKNGLSITPLPYNIASITDWMVLTANTESPDNSRTYRIGASEGYFASLEIAEILGYNSVLSDTDRRKVEQYLGSKYGITVQ